ncbi:hypothetical protein [Rhizobacter sp. Root1221]|uniref:hypothetical protein n=1 Tax=Rhizobacter sp. Root1221 TaxID=1736433 RepID=UPI0006FF7F97|nr:hypothetical protein [Rhizobacter sp. Root1221]KQW01515.1 hypothetical protein ASC87_14340 [Rhizobacter sp. Root1221]
MFRHLTVIVLAFIGDLSFGKPMACVALAALVIALAYWSALPTELPLWPAHLVLAVAAVVGFVWQDRSRL